MNDLIFIPNMDSTPYKELLHSENNSDEEVEIDDDELEALNDDNPFFLILTLKRYIIRKWNKFHKKS